VDFVSVILEVVFCSQMQASWIKSSPPRRGRLNLLAFGGFTGAAATAGGGIDLDLDLAFDLALALAVEIVGSGVGSGVGMGECKVRGSANHTPSTSLRYILRASS
jgi:hypothetical protein